MAKITAYGATKVDVVSYDWYDDSFDGGVIRYSFALNSRGVILKAVTWPLSSDAELRRKTWSIVAKGCKTAESFRRYASDHRPVTT